MFHMWWNRCSCWYFSNVILDPSWISWMSWIRLWHHHHRWKLCLAVLICFCYYFRVLLFFRVRTSYELQQFKSQQGIWHSHTKFIRCNSKQNFFFAICKLCMSFSQFINLTVFQSVSLFKSAENSSPTKMQLIKTLGFFSFSVDFFFICFGDKMYLRANNYFECEQICVNALQFQISRIFFLKIRLIFNHKHIFKNNLTSFSVEIIWQLNWFI